MDKIAMYKEAIYKEARNRADIEAFLKQVGVAPFGPKKWIVRRLSDPIGNPLTGKALYEAKRKIGFMPNNTYQEIKKMSNKVNKLAPYSKFNKFNSPITELGGTYDNKTGIIKNITEGASRAGSVGSEEGNNFHTHPGTTDKRIYYMKKDTPIENRMRSGNKITSPLIADMSGGIDTFGGVNGKNFNTDKENSILRKKNILQYQRDRLYEFHNKLCKDPDKSSSGFAKAIGKMDRMDPIFDKNKKDLMEVKEKLIKTPVGKSKDYYGEGLVTNKAYMTGKPHTEYIVAPEAGYQAVHKVRADNRYKRSVFFDRNPKETKI